MTTRGKRLKEARQKKGFRSARAAALAFRFPVSTYGAHERAELRGGRDYGPEEAKLYGRLFGVAPEWLLTGYAAQGERRSKSAAQHSAGKLTIVGYIGTSGTVRMYEVDPQALERTDTPLPIEQSTVALEIRDGSIMGVLPRNWLLLYDDERALPIPDLVGTLCVIAHKNHQIAVRVLTADERGLRWVAPVKAIIPR